MARLAAADGVQIIVATPHVSRELNYPEPALVRELVARLNRALQVEKLPLRVLPGSEAPAEPELLEALQAGRILTVGDRGRHVLVELPPNAPAIYAPELFFRLQLAGFTPIIAHIERAAIFRAQPQILQEMHDRGYVLQMNADSLSADWHTRRYARRLLQQGLVDVLASDGHDASRRKPLLSPASRAIRGHSELFEQLTRTGPAALLRVSRVTGGKEEKTASVSPS